MVLSKSDLRDPLNNFFFSSEKNYVYLQKNIFVPIDHHTKYKMSKLNFCGTDKKKKKKKKKKIV